MEEFDAQTEQYDGGDDARRHGLDPSQVYAPDRKGERPEAHLGDFAGILQVDGYGGYAALARRRQQIQLTFCWAHVRRKFYELATARRSQPRCCAASPCSTPSRRKSAERRRSSAA